MKKKTILNMSTNTPHQSGPNKGRTSFVPSPFNFRRCFQAGLIAVAVAVITASCAPMHREPQEVASNPPSVTYKYLTDAELIEANSRARVYCSQYAATPSMKGVVTVNSDGTKEVTFECIKPMGTPPPSPPPMQYSYSSDAELVQALNSAEAYCARSGQIASSNITTNPNGTKTLSFSCIPR